ncbi:hypothetical protein K2173_015689 [Erythroxylum novogranatense]|uniref:Uncharacterized protein n=1 Tax=Erythroxylum novogranatense TaxID=1862640 RepID=A0AAV8SEG2_9ROSI|nr:hypothetical protein K2173_015689 [Erythroxylum novogranatense]
MQEEEAVLTVGSSSLKDVPRILLFFPQDQRRLGAIVVPNKEEVLLKAKKSAVVDPKGPELSGNG